MDKSPNKNLFKVSIKALFFNDNDKLMMIREDNGLWEVPGGKINKGEEFIEALKRECIEETGLECEVLDEHPYIIYPTLDRDAKPRIMIFFRVKFDNLDFTPSDECEELKFFSKAELLKLNIYPQLIPLLEYL